VPAPATAKLLAGCQMFKFFPYFLASTSQQFLYLILALFLND